MCTVLCVVTLIDYITGILYSIIKNEVCSKVGFKGICKKVLMFCIVGITYLLSVYVLYDSIIYEVILGFYIANECISILENSEKCGVAIPKPLAKIIKSLRGDYTNVEDTKQSDNNKL